jgi:hypothetical protein
VVLNICERIGVRFPVDLSILVKSRIVACIVAGETSVKFSRRQDKARWKRHTVDFQVVASSCFTGSDASYNPRFNQNRIKLRI